MEKSRRFEKIACEPSQGAGTGGQGRITQIPVRGLKLVVVDSDPFAGRTCRITQIPVRGLKLSIREHFGENNNLNVVLPKSP